MFINYDRSGIKTLRGASLAFLIISVIASLMLIPTWTTEKGYHDKINWLMIVLSLATLFFGIFTYAVGLAIATIAENSLYQKQKAELSGEED